MAVVVEHRLTLLVTLVKSDKTVALVVEVDLALLSILAEQVHKVVMVVAAITTLLLPLGQVEVEVDLAEMAVLLETKSEVLGVLEPFLGWRWRWWLRWKWWKCFISGRWRRRCWN